MKKKTLVQLFLLLFLAGIVYACKKDDNELPPPPDGLPPAVSEAKTWFDNQAKDGTIPWNPPGGGKSFTLTPDWKTASSTEDSNYKVTEVRVNGVTQFFIVSSECSAKYQETGDKRYLAWDIRFVVRTNKKTQIKDGLTMVTYPDLSYLEAHLDQPFKDVSYLKCPPDFSGSIMFFNMNGEFVNGWKYVDGTANPLYLKTT